MNVGTPIRPRPSNLGAAAALGAMLLAAQTSGSYRSQQFFDVRNDPLLTQDGYWLLNARLAYVADGGRWELAGFGRNLTGAEYLNYAVNLSSPFGLLEEVVGAPRSGGVEATIRF